MENNVYEVLNFSDNDIVEESYGVSQIQKRAHEDAYQIKLIGKLRYYAIFDGHGGPFKLKRNHVAKYCVDNLHNKIEKYLSNVDLNNEEYVCKAIIQAFMDLDTEMYTNGIYFGSTCTCLLIDDERRKIYQVNLGDSRSILFINDKIISITIDHHPDNEEEKLRIEKGGGTVSYGRVNGDLAVTRSFGDFDLKSNREVTYDPVNGIISAVPDIKVINLDTIDFNPLNIQERIIFMLTSDAPFEDMTFEKFFNETIRQLSENTYDFSLTTSRLTQWLKRQTSDDITIIIGKV